MIETNDSLLALVDRIRRKAPEYLDLLTAETDAEFDHSFNAVLGDAIDHLEKNKKNFKDLDEEGLSAALAGRLTIPGLTVTQETNSNGHVDLTIEADHCVPMRKILGEAKIYKGPVYHLGGLDQLIGRYTTGRESRGLLIVYVKKKGILGLVNKLRIKMDADRPQHQKGTTQDHTLKWAFISTHVHDCGDDVKVAHIGCNLYIAK